MLFKKELQIVANNEPLLTKLANMQSLICDLTNADPVEKGMLVFSEDGTCIHNPFYSHCFRFQCNPVVEYGTTFLESNWVKLDVVQATIDKLTPMYMDVLKEQNIHDLFHAARFEIEGVDNIVFDGYTDDTTWNGWARPYFNKEQAMEVMKAFDEKDAPAYYDEAEDTFCFTDVDGDITPFEGEDICVNGEIIRAYPIGASYWVWVKCEEVM